MSLKTWMSGGDDVGLPAKRRRSDGVALAQLRWAQGFRIERFVTGFENSKILGPFLLIANGGQEVAASRESGRSRDWWPRSERWWNRILAVILNLRCSGPARVLAPWLAHSKRTGLK